MYSIKAPVKKAVNPKTAPKFDYDEPGNPWDHVNSVDDVKQHNWVTVVDWCYSPHRIRQGRVVKTFKGSGYVHEYTDPDGNREGHWKEHPWIEVRFGPKNVERIDYDGYSKLQAIYKYDQSIQDEYEADMKKIHRYNSKEEDEDDDMKYRMICGKKMTMAQMYDLKSKKSVGGGAGR